jgi:hypothetical protein
LITNTLGEVFGAIKNAKMKKINIAAMRIALVSFILKTIGNVKKERQKRTG